MSHNREHLLPDMTQPGLIQLILKLDPNLKKDVLAAMTLGELMHLDFSLQRKLAKPPSTPESLDQMLIVTADRDGLENRLLPHRVNSPEDRRSIHSSRKRKRR